MQLWTLSISAARLANILLQSTMEPLKDRWASIRKQALYLHLTCISIDVIVYLVVEFEDHDVARSARSVPCRSQASSQARHHAADVGAHSSIHALAFNRRLQPPAVASTPTQSIGNFEAFSDNSVVLVEHASPCQVAHWCSHLSAEFLPEILRRVGDQADQSACPTLGPSTFVPSFEKERLE